MATSNQHGSMQKVSQYSKHNFSEKSQKTRVGLHKSEVQTKKMLDTLEQQQNTAVNNISNHQQAMKMSWRRLEERRAESPLLTRHDKTKEEPKNTKRGLMLQSNTRLYVNKTPEIYNPGLAESGSADDMSIGKTSNPEQDSSRPKSRGPPPPTQLTRAHTSPYISSPFNFRKTPAAIAEERKSRGVSATLSETKLSASEESSTELQSSSQVNVTNKEALLKASTLMSSSSSGPESFKQFYSDRSRVRSGHIPLQTPAQQQLQASFSSLKNEEELQDQKDDMEAGSSELTLAEQFEQIKHCRYIRHYYPDGTALEEY